MTNDKREHFARMATLMGLELLRDSITDQIDDVRHSITGAQNSDELALANGNGSSNGHRRGRPPLKQIAAAVAGAAATDAPAMRPRPQKRGGNHNPRAGMPPAPGTQTHFILTVATQHGGLVDVPMVHAAIAAAGPELPEMVRRLGRNTMAVRTCMAAMIERGYVVKTGERGNSQARLTDKGRAVVSASADLVPHIPEPAPPPLPPAPEPEPESITALEPMPEPATALTLRKPGVPVRQGPWIAEQARTHRKGLISIDELMKRARRSPHKKLTQRPTASVALSQATRDGYLTRVGLGVYKAND